MRASLSSLVLLFLLELAAPTAPLAAQSTAAIPAGTYRGTVSFGDRIIPVQVRSSETGDVRLQVAVSFEDTTPRRMWRDSGGDTLLAVLPGPGDTLRLAVPEEGVGTVALKPASDPSPAARALGKAWLSG